MPAQVELASQTGGGAMSMVGRVSFESEAHRLVLLTPAGKTRAYDVICKSIWFHVAGMGHPHKGLIVEFDIDRASDGSIEAVSVRLPELQPPSTEPGYETTCGSDGVGAVPAAVWTPAAGNNPEVR